MIALQITELKPFMSRLFLEDAFDGFLLSEALFVTFNTFRIEGTFQKEFFSAEERERQHMEEQAFSFWRQVRPFCLELIRGKRTPLEFKIVFRLSPANTEKLLYQAQLPLSGGDVDGLFLNLHYRQGVMHCTTGTSLRLFTLDRSLDRVWDEMVKKFFAGLGLSFETL